MAGGLWFVSRQYRQDTKGLEDHPASSQEARTQVPSEKIIDFNKLDEKTDKALTALMKERKAPYGIEKSIDMVVKPDESIKVGKQTVQMKRIMDEVRLSQGEILETDLKTGARKEGPDEYGIHVVQPGENIWDVHFKLLKDYYDHKNIQLSPLADEPDSRGFSSGVGKILKFSEDMVHIYNLHEKRLDTDLDLIYPRSKIVIYNMTHVFGLLDRIDYADVQRIEFDGETLWLPAEK